MIYSTLARSFSEAMGSWKIIWILRMTSLSSSLEILPLIFWPLKKMSPPEVGLMRQMARPMVVLPDSPTSEKVSPL